MIYLIILMIFFWDSVTLDPTYEEACTEHAKGLKNLVIYWTVKCKREMKLLMKIAFSTRHTIRCVVTVNIMSM
jgi:hypothetical protein